MVAAREVARRDLLEHRFLLAANVGGVAAARMEVAALAAGWPDWRLRPRGGCASSGRADRASAPPRAALRCRGASACRTVVSVGAVSTIRADIHHRDAVAELLHDAEVVRDEEVGEPELVAEVGQEVQHLRLHRDVERGDRLVGDDQARVERQRAGDADALALAAAEGMREARACIRGAARRAAAARRRAPRARCASACRSSAAARRRDRASVMRGLSEENGSWKIIWMSRRS